ncbi:MAG: hypothetical protein JWM70_1862 [Microbacteriaceae bacterium]|nr:hypothetical protein [Microbacteriaceae bacterium]
MPWWSWFLIWGGLSLLLLMMLAAFGWLLFRKVMAVFGALEALGALAGLLHDADDILTDQRERISILDRGAIRRRRDRVRELAMLRRQWRHDTRIARAKALIAVDASQREWFERGDHRSNPEAR